MTAERPERPADPIRFRSSDGTELAGDLTVPTTPWAVGVVCHPHPQFGGNRFHPVVGAVHRLLPDHGVASLRFDVRAEFDGGEGELRDTEAAVAEARRRVPGVPVLLSGYSFGAVMALLASQSCLGVAAIAPPLAMQATLSGPSAPCLILVPESDQFTDVAAARAAVADWPDARVQVVDGADHFLVGHDRPVAARVVDFFATLRP